MDEYTLRIIENDHSITTKTDAVFLHEFQNAILLSLIECGTLTEMQYRYAKENLRTYSLESKEEDADDPGSKLLPCFHGQGRSGKLF